MRLDEQATEYLRRAINDLRATIDFDSDYEIMTECIDRIAGRLEALLKLKGDDASIPEPIIKQERKHYPTAKTEVCVGENRDLPHRIPGYHDYYASPMGRIWSYKSGRWLKSQTQSGKPRVQLTKRGLSASESVAKLVLVTHDVAGIGGKISGKIGYRDGDPLNVKLENLYWRA